MRALGVRCGGSTDGLETSRLIYILASVLLDADRLWPPRTFLASSIECNRGQRSCQHRHAL